MYKGIEDMPIFNWWEATENGNLSAVLLNPRKMNRRLSNKVKERYRVIKAEYFDKIALNPELERYLLKIVKLESMRCSLLIEHDFYIETQYRILQAQIQAEENKAIKNAGGNYEHKAILEKNMGFRIDVHNTTIVEYHAYINHTKNDFKNAAKVRNREN